MSVPLPILSKTCWSPAAAPLISPVINLSLAEVTNAVRRAGQARVTASNTNNARVTTGGTL